MATFRRFLRETDYPGGPDLLAAKMVGRWADGTPLELAPHKPDPRRISDNDFTYGDDMQGVRCPMGAHIRRMNPRDSLGFEGTLINRHRIIRRGMPYGELTPADQPGGGIVPSGRNADGGGDSG